MAATKPGAIFLPVDQSVSAWGILAACVGVEDGAEDAEDDFGGIAAAMGIVETKVFRVTGAGRDGTVALAVASFDGTDGAVCFTNHFLDAIGAPDAGGKPADAVHGGPAFADALPESVGAGVAAFELGAQLVHAVFEGGDGVMKERFVAAAGDVAPAMSEFAAVGAEQVVGEAVQPPDFTAEQMPGSVVIVIVDLEVVVIEFETDVVVVEVIASAGVGGLRGDEECGGSDDGGGGGGCQRWQE